ncbi:MAG: glycoside hydrolase family 88 protein [Cellvibrio sp.]
MIVLSYSCQRKLVIAAGLLTIFLSACSKKAETVAKEIAPESIAVAEISNANNFPLKSELIYFSFYDLGLAAGDSRRSQLGVIKDNEYQAIQVIDKNGDGELDGILVAADFAPAQIQSFNLVSTKTDTKKQSDDGNKKDVAAIENNLRAANFGAWDGKVFSPIPQFGKQKATTTNVGNLLTGFKVNYQDWNFNGQPTGLNTHVSASKNTHLTHVSVTANKTIPNFALSLAKGDGKTLFQGDTNITGSAWTYVAIWDGEKITAENSKATAILFHRADRKEQTENENAYVSVMNTNGGDLEYYIVNIPAKTDEIKTQADFKAYLEEETQRLTKTPRIRFESSFSKQAKVSLQANDALTWAKRLADSELERKTLNYHFGGWDEYRKRPAKFEYDVVGMQIHALQEIDAIQPDERYQNALTKITGSYIQNDGSIATFEPDLFSIDLTKPGQMVILLAQRTKEEKYRKAADYLRERLKVHPRTSEGAFWHRATYPNQLWLDGVYMGIPFLVQYAAAYETGKVQHESFKEAVHEFVIARNQLRNPETGLYYHAWDESKKAEWADKQTGRASQYWSRGMGWYAMALVDVLDYIPATETDLRKTLTDIINEFAADILRYQDPATATWWQITDRPNDLGNYRESSSTAMFAYFLLKSVNNGYLPKSYGDAALKTYRGLINEFVTLHQDGKMSMNDQCLVAGLGFGRDGSYNYYQTELIVSNDPKGNSPFIYASVEAYKFLKPANELTGNFK